LNQFRRVPSTKSGTRTRARENSASRRIPEISPGLDDAWPHMFMEERRYPFAPESYLNETGRIFGKFAAGISVLTTLAIVPLFRRNFPWCGRSRNSTRGPALLLTHTDNMGRAMSFLIYFAVLLFTAASALFGLDLMTSPLPAARHHHPRPQVADNATPAKADTAPAQKQAGKSTNALASRDDDKTKSDRALSPVYPTSPGV